MSNTGSDYLKFSLMSALLIGILPMLFRVYKTEVGKPSAITCTEAATKVRTLKYLYPELPRDRYFR